MIRKMHCVIAISYLINTDVLITFALRQATSTSPLECCSGAGSWMLYIGTTDTISLFFADSPLLTPAVRAGHEASPHPQQVLAKAC